MLFVIRCWIEYWYEYECVMLYGGREANDGVIREGDNVWRLSIHAGYTMRFDFILFFYRVEEIQAGPRLMIFGLFERSIVL